MLKFRQQHEQSETDDIFLIIYQFDGVKHQKLGFLYPGCTYNHQLVFNMAAAPYFLTAKSPAAMVWPNSRREIWLPPTVWKSSIAPVFFLLTSNEAKS